MKYKLLLLMALSSGLLSAPVAATVNTNAHVGTYNLIIKNDLNLHSHVDGKAIIGGDINPSNSSNIAEFGSKISDSNVDPVVVLGNVNSLVKAQSGTNIVYGQVTSTGSFQLNGGGTATQIVDNVGAQADFDAIWDKVVADSITFKNMAPNVDFITPPSVDNNLKRFVNNNALDLNVFTITTEYLENDGAFDFTNAPTTPIVINVGGKNINLTTQANGYFATPASASLVLWNFYEAETITFNKGTWWGSVLAPFADIVVGGNGNNLEGGIAALSLTTNKEIHNSLYSYTPPTTNPPTEEVPAPAGIFLIGLGLLIMVRRKFAK